LLLQQEGHHRIVFGTDPSSGVPGRLGDAGKERRWRRGRWRNICGRGLRGRHNRRYLIRFERPDNQLRCRFGIRWRRRCLLSGKLKESNDQNRHGRRPQATSMYSCPHLAPAGSTMKRYWRLS
jgi:hypothetical protein